MCSYGWRAVAAGHRQKYPRPFCLGYFFSLGHSTVVIAMGVAIVVAQKLVFGQIINSNSTLERFGTLISAGFLFLIGSLNLVILAGITRVFPAMRRGEYDEDELERQLDSRSLLYRGGSPPPAAAGKVAPVELQDVIMRRRMVRRFTAEPVDAASLDRILANAVRGPSAGFSQGQAFLVLTAAADRAAFWEVAGEAVSPTAQTAPLVIVPMSSKRVYLDRYAEPDKGWTDRDEARWPVPFWHIDTGMATLLILLTAVDEGLGAVYFGIVPEAVDKFRAAFGVPDDYEPIGAIAIGHDAETEKRDLRARRRPLADMVHYDRW